MHNINSILIAEYSSKITVTDVLKHSDFDAVLQGLYGEVGGIMSTAKKLTREKGAFPGFRKAAEEEFGDTLWYFAAICRRLNICLEEIFLETTDHVNYPKIDATDVDTGILELAENPAEVPVFLNSTLVKLGKSAADMLGDVPTRKKVYTFAAAYIDAINAAKLDLDKVIICNLRKAQSAFIFPNPEVLANLDFDNEFDVEEQLPQEFMIRINQRGSGKSYLQWNGVFIGDPLTDNIADNDGYRFHDVFHFAYAAILHWSPVIRALIKHKRKSSRKHDEEQDSGRAIVVEEGLTAWIFSRAKDLELFEGHNNISLGMLKIISEFVRGYEVEDCPLKLWEKAILDGYSVFRDLKKNQGGWIVGNRRERTLKFLPLETEL
jgi:NTP pyrophosphatase (non-canonical NTP hydrolase)